MAKKAKKCEIIMMGRRSGSLIIEISFGVQFIPPLIIANDYKASSEPDYVCGVLIFTFRASSSDNQMG